MENIFEEAIFGDRFVCRNGTIAIFWYQRETGDFDHPYKTTLITANLEVLSPYENGYLRGVKISTGEQLISDLDIVSRYKEPIDEDKLEKLATKWGLDYINTHTNMHVSIQGDTILDVDITKAFKAGYRKAMEE